MILQYNFFTGQFDHEVQCDIDFWVEPADPSVGITRPTVHLESVYALLIRPDGVKVEPTDPSFSRRLCNWAHDYLEDEDMWRERALDLYLGSQ